MKRGIIGSLLLGSVPAGATPVVDARLTPDEDIELVVADASAGLFLL
jgi:hypothetical protein